MWTAFCLPFNFTLSFVVISPIPFIKRQEYPFPHTHTRIFKSRCFCLKSSKEQRLCKFDTEKSEEMGKVYDDWERLVEAVLRREKLRQLCYVHSRTPSQSSSDSTSLLDDESGRTSSLRLQATMAMVRLQEELICTLTQNKQCFDHGYMSLSTCEKDSVHEESVVLVKHYSVQNASPRQSSSTESEEYVLDLLHPDMIPRIKSITNIMFASHYDQEFCEAFVGFGRGAFAVYLTILNVEELSIEDVVQMELKCLNSRIRKWRLAIKNFIRLYLANAKHLFDQVLGEYGHISSSCLIEASKASLMCFLNFGHAVAVGPHQPERLYCLLDMYEDLAALIPDLETLFPEDIGSCIRVEFYDLLTRLGDSAKVILNELGKHIGSFSSTRPWLDGGIHPLTEYVINYILCFADYDYTLNLLLEETDGENLNKGPIADLEQNISGPVAAHVQSLTSVLEANIDKKSNLYKDSSLKHIFMLNNIHYTVEKIKNSKIRTYFGDEWIKNRVRKFQFHAMSYQSNTWRFILPLLSLDGKTDRQRNTWSFILPLLRLRRDAKMDRATLKARCRDFTIAFENVYMNQTGWCVPNNQLREELRILTSSQVVPAYRNLFYLIKTTTHHPIGKKHIKYTEHDLENYILDLFEGSSKSLNPPQKGQKS